MKVRLVSLLVVSAISSSFAEPGGTYTLTGKEKGISEIIKSDMAQFPELYKGETLNSYLTKFKAENKIGYKKYKPGDQLKFPATSASRKIKNDKNEKGRRAAKIDCEEETVRFREGAPVFTNASKFLYEIPQGFGGQELTVREKMSSAPLEFEVKEAGIVTLVAVPKDAMALKAQGWTEVNKVLVGRDDEQARMELPILTKELEAGHYSVPCSANFGTRLLID